MTENSETHPGVIVTGKVTWVGPRRTRVRMGAFSCRHCRTEILEPQPEGEIDLRFPRVCYLEQGGCGVDDYVEGFDFLNQHSTHEACQRLRLAGLAGGARWTVVLTGDLVGAAVRGARITVEGRVIVHPRRGAPGGKDECHLLVGQRVGRANAPVV